MLFIFFLLKQDRGPGDRGAGHGASLPRIDCSRLYTVDLRDDAEKIRYSESLSVNRPMTEG